MSKRPQLLFTWEMGGNYGHANKIVQLAQAVAPWADVTIAAKNPVAIREMAPDLPARLLPAAITNTRPMHPGEPQSACFAGALLQDGWDRADHLSPLVETWRNLLDLVQPDVVIAQAAPTAILAAKTWRKSAQHLPIVILGSGYDNPPLTTPMPLFDTRLKGAAQIAAAQEKQALGVGNSVLAQHQIGGQSSFADLIRPELSLLVCWPEIDHYADRAQDAAGAHHYLGPLTTLGAGGQIRWRDRDVPRVFAYLRPNTPQSVAGFGALHARAPDLDVILAAPGIERGEAEQLIARGVQVVDGPAQLDLILGDCDLAISHFGNGVVAACLEHGIPQIGLPSQREQAMLARAMADRGLCLGIEGSYGPAEVDNLIQRVLDTPLYRSNAKAAAAQVTELSSAAAADRAAAKLAELIDRD